MKNLFLLSILFFFNLALLSAQKSELQKYDWEKDPAPYSPNADEKDKSQFEIFYRIKKEIIVNKKEVNEYNLVHFKRFINSDDAIEGNNKVYLSTKSDETVVKNLARIVKPNGDVIQLKKSDIQEAKDEQTGRIYKYFAVKGLVKGSYLERLTLIKDTPSFGGYPITIQDAFLTKDFNFELIYPDHLVFESKIFNHTEQLSKNEEKYENKISESINIERIEGLIEEDYSNIDRHLKKIIYKLTGNNNSARYGLNGYTGFVDNFKSFYTSELSKKDKKALQNYIKKFNFSGNVAEDIRMLEDDFKTNIRVLDNFSGEESIAYALQNKNTSEILMSRIYSSIFDLQKIPYQVVLTTNRFQLPFDEKFECLRYLQNLAFYFPEQNAYLGVKSNAIRYPMLFYGWMNNYGLFLKQKKIGKNNLFVGEIKHIALPNSDFTTDYQDAVIDFTEDINEPNVHSVLKFNGFSSTYYAPVLEFAEKDDQTEFLESIASNYAGAESFEDLDIKMSTENNGLKHLFKKPFILDLNFNGKDLIENAGNKRIFSIGKIIGRQKEMYQEEERKMPLELNFPHQYQRKFKIILPEGYTIKNLDQLNEEHTLKKDNSEIAKYKTEYSQNGNEILITYLEFYDLAEYTKEQYSSYVEIINAAADFNKIKLVLEKQ